MIDDDTLKSLERLHQLKTDGVITEADFESTKQRLLQEKPRAAVRTANPQWNGELPAYDDFFGWVLLPLKRYADFNGRSCRKEFWMFQLIHVGIIVLTFGLVSEDRDMYGEPGVIAGLTLFSAILALLGLVVPQIALQVRRFHDQDKPGWLALLNLVPWLGQLAIFVFMLIDGTEGENRYGPDPKGR